MVVDSKSQYTHTWLSYAESLFTDLSFSSQITQTNILLYSNKTYIWWFYTKQLVAIAFLFCYYFFFSFSCQRHLCMKTSSCKMKHPFNFCHIIFLLSQIVSIFVFLSYCQIPSQLLLKLLLLLVVANWLLLIFISLLLLLLCACICLHNYYLTASFFLLFTPTSHDCVICVSH